MDKNEAMVLTIAEAAKVLKIARSTLYTCLNTRQLPSIKIGKRRLILASDLQEWLKSKSITGGGND